MVGVITLKKSPTALTKFSFHSFLDLTLYLTSGIFGRHDILDILRLTRGLLLFLIRRGAAVGMKPKEMTFVLQAWRGQNSDRRAVQNGAAAQPGVERPFDAADVSKEVCLFSFLPFSLLVVMVVVVVVLFLVVVVS
ncbi:MAG: hypothetical protein ABJN34_05585 [Litoreibacter sp.]|uniref:hypothetical protein n=1 Tax=Litoreibacter sp. TaxID=1969459 RepID=UPI00329965E4